MQKIIFYRYATKSLLPILFHLKCKSGMTQYYITYLFYECDKSETIPTYCSIQDRHNKSFIFWLNKIVRFFKALSIISSLLCLHYASDTKSKNICCHKTTVPTYSRIFISRSFHLFCHISPHATYNLLGHMPCHILVLGAFLAYPLPCDAVPARLHQINTI